MIAPPYFWSQKISMKNNLCGNAFYASVKVVSESQMKGNFLFRIHRPTNYSPIEFVEPATKKFLIPEDCFHLQFSAQSLSGGVQVIRVMFQ